MQPNTQIATTRRRKPSSPQAVGIIALLIAIQACGSGVVVEGDSWSEDAYLASDSTTVSDVSDVSDVAGGKDILEDARATADTGMLDAAVADVFDAGGDIGQPIEVPFENLPAVYGHGQIHSPITPFVAANLRAIAGQNPELNDDVFAKVGASNTVNTNFIQCFSDPERVDLDGRDGLEQTIAHFRAGLAGATDPYVRTSLAATVGWSAGAALSGSPSPLARELAEISPRYALVMFGTNDIGRRNIFEYGANLLTIADVLIANGTIPVFTSIPSRGDSAEADAAVPRYNAVQRAVAQARQVPFINTWQEWLDIPARGLISDGVHLNTYQRGCILTEAGLGFGHNIRNLRTIELLDRLRQVLDEAAAPDAPTEPVHGDGSRSDPFLITSLPFVDARDTSLGGRGVIDRYTGCNATQDESGKEFIYRFVTDRTVRIRALIIDRAPADIDLHLLDHSATAEGCIERNHREIVRELAAGTYHFSLDTFVSAGGTVHSGEYLFLLLED
ncbi:MAG: SGNH/GDSL hydrolase family protein [Bradymonadaceae bacterium]|nr:SGNH/GDSL hydrolase family protein [Lujinxingiaceae bacterium]